MTQLTPEKNHYQLFLLPYPLKTQKRSLLAKKYINIPKICPICGSKKVVYSKKINPTFFLSKQKYHRQEMSKLKMYFCINHFRNKKKEILIASIYLLLMTIMPLTIFINVYNALQMIFLALILSGISFGIGLYGYINEIRNDYRYLQMIRKSFFFEVYYSIGAIISIDCFKWAMELDKSNKCYRVENIDFEKLDDLEALAMKYKKRMNYSALFACMMCVGMPITLIIFEGFIDIFLGIILIIIISSLFWGKFLYEFLKQFPVDEQRFRIFKEFMQNNRQIIKKNLKNTLHEG